MRTLLIFFISFVFSNVLAKTPFTSELVLKNKFVNKYFCGEEEFNSSKKRNPSLFRKKDLKYDGTCPILAEDKLRITPNKEKELIINLETHYYNGHQCSLINEKFIKKGSEYIFKKNEMGSENREDFCTIALTYKENLIKFKVLNKANEMGCRVFCGVRGSLDDVTFKYRYSK